jgi:hypothetical protein
MIEQDINILLETLRQSFITIMTKYDLDKSDLVKKSRFVYKDGLISILMDDYSEYIDKGRRRGKMPPVKDIITWIRTSAINVPLGLTVEDFAWAVSKSISNKGIKAKPFIEQLNDEVNDLTLKYMFNQVNENIKKTFKIK